MLHECHANKELVETFYKVPVANASGYLNNIKKICKKSKINVLIPGSEAELKVISNSRDYFDKQKIFLPINKKSLIDLCMDKASLNSKLKSLGFLVPKYIETFERSKIDKIDFFPIILKPRTGGKGSKNVFLAQSKKQLIALGDYLNISDKSSDFIIQEYTGTPDQEFTVGVLHDSEGYFIDGIALRRDLTKAISVRTIEKNLTDKKSLGEYLVVSSGVSQGVIGAFPKITNQCRKIADALGSTGPLNIQCRFINGKVSVFEINPRFSGTTSIRAIAGLNEPDLLIQSKFEIVPQPSNFNRSDKIIERVLIEVLVK
jgi:carbamoyl-phosphate synthase large subunit